MSITTIEEYKANEINKALRELLQRSENHQLRAFMFAVKTGPRKHRFGLTGEYLVDPFQALACLSRMGYKCNQLISARDDEPQTSLAPL